MTVNMEFWDDGMVPPTNEYKRLPGWVQQDLTTYLVEGNPFISDFLYGVLTNDLMKVCEHGDPEAMTCLKDLTMVVYNRLPGLCWGSKEKVEEWKKIGGWNGYRAAEEAKSAT